MLSKWYGEFEWDNFTVKFHSHRGQKTGVVIEYGKNLTALEQDEDNSGVYTALLPYAVYTPEGADTETVVRKCLGSTPVNPIGRIFEFHTDSGAIIKFYNKHFITFGRIFLKFV